MRVSLIGRGPRRHPGTLVAALCALMLVLVACGAEDADEAPDDADGTEDAVDEDDDTDGTDDTADEAVEADVVQVGVIGSLSDAGFYIARDLGIFDEYDIEVEFSDFPSAAQMVAPLGQGDLDVGGGAPSAGLFNAVASDVAVRAVADKGSSPAGSGYGYPFVVRADLVESGEVGEVADLEGRTLAMVAEGSTAESIPAVALRNAGLEFDDMEHLYLPFPDQISAFENGSIDASVLIEPFAAIAEAQGLVVRFPSSDEIEPDGQGAVVLYSEQFMADRPEVAERFMMAYIEAARLYNEALADGGWAEGDTAQEIIDILVANTPIEDEELLRSTQPIGINPDGEMNPESMRTYLDFWVEIGRIEAEISPEDVIEDSFRQAAVEQLGPYEAGS